MMYMLHTYINNVHVVYVYMHMCAFGSAWA